MKTMGNTLTGKQAPPVTKKKFKRIFVEITNHCNLSCSFCPTSSREKRRMTTEEFETVLKKIDGHGDHVYLHVKGEPLSHPDFKSILDLCTLYNKKVNITTNATLIDKRGNDILRTPSVRLVNLSLQSFENISDSNAYIAYLDRILNFVSQGLKETEILFEFRLWNAEDRIKPSGLKAMDGYTSTIDYIQSKLGRSIPVTSQNTKGDGGKSRIYFSKGMEFEWPSLENDFVSESGNCYGLRGQIAILSDGTVVPCCLDAEGIIALGNIFTQDFSEIINSKRARTIAGGFENRKLIEKLCQHCSYREQYL